MMMCSGVRLLFECMLFSVFVLVMVLWLMMRLDMSRIVVASGGDASSGFI